MSLLLTLRTVRHLKPSQIVARVAYRLFTPTPDLAPPPPLRAAGGPWAPPPRRLATQTGQDRFRLLGEDRIVATDQDWDREEWPKLWRYHLHYHEDLIANGAAQRAAWHDRLIRRWIAENPPGRGTGWEPYPVSRRIVNWIVRHVERGDLPNVAVASLAVQVRWLRRRLEWHLLGNHLLVNASALVIAGLFFEGPEAESWLGEGMRLLGRELCEQVLTDGGHFERSPMYHALALEDLLLVLAMLRRCVRAAPPDWIAIAQRMLRWQRIMTHPDGRIALFNDAAFDQAHDIDALASWARALGVDVSGPDEQPLILLPNSGFARLAIGPAVVFADVGGPGPSYQPGHAHAGALGFELSLDGARVIVDSGTSEYGVSSERLRQRGTAAHNSVVVDGADSSEVWSGFRVGRRARVRNVAGSTGDGFVDLVAEHDGYRRLRGVRMHRRRLHLEACGLMVEDVITGAGTHSILAALHLHPSVTARISSEIAATIDCSRTISAALDSRLKWEIEPATWHPTFGTSQPSQRLLGRGSLPLPERIVVRLEWDR